MAEPNFSPAADRNKQHILEVLQQLLADEGSALEIASGTGQHVACFAESLPRWTWQPTDEQAQALDAISALAAQSGLMNVRTPLRLDVMALHWLPPGDRFDLIYCANMLHIAPWVCCAALMQGCVRHLAEGGQVVTYGPYLENDIAISEGNLAFDQSLRAQNPAWGIRRREDVENEAQRAGLQLAARHPMPANNLLLVWTRA